LAKDGTENPSRVEAGGRLTGIDTQTLRGLAYTAPYLHDGSASDLAAVFDPTNAPAGSPHASFRTLSATQQSELITFLLELDGSEPAPLFSPKLDASLFGSSIVLSWPASAIGFSLQSTTNLIAPLDWTAVTNPIVSTGGLSQVVLPLGQSKRFFRLGHQ